MLLVTKCCCCDIRKGSVASAIYAMIIAALGLGVSAFKIHFFDMHSVSHLSPWAVAFFFASCIDIGLYSFLFLSAIMLLYGVKNYRRFLFMPYIICMSVLLVLQILAVILRIIGGTVGIIGLLVLGLVICLNIYCVLCVRSYYKELGSELPFTEPPPEKSGSDVNQLENASSVSPYHGPPMMNLCPGEAVVVSPPYQPLVDPRACENKESYSTQV